MRRALPGVDAELAAAVARVAELYAEIPEDRRPDITGERWHELEARIDEASGWGDAVAARRAIELWEGHARRVLGALVQGAAR